jgi:hypothetical protein
MNRGREEYVKGGVARHIVTAEEATISAFEGSQAMPARPSSKGKFDTR